MTDQKDPTPSDVPRNYLAAFVHLYRETQSLPEEDRTRVAREKVEALASGGWKVDIGNAAKTRATLVPLARESEGEEFARWLDALFAQLESEGDG